MNRYETLKNINPAETAIKNKQLNVKRSAFNYNQSLFMPLQFGLIHVVDCVRMLPNTDYELRLNAVMQSRNPLVRNPFSSARWFAKQYFVKDIDCWMGAYSALANRRPNDDTVQKTFPKIKLKHSHEEDGVTSTLSSCTPMSLADMLGVPPDYYNPENPIHSFVPAFVEDEDVVKCGESIDGINAIPFVGYQKICRELMNPNIINENRNWLPTNDELFRLPPDCEEANVLSYDAPLMDAEDFIGLDFSVDGSVMVPQNDSDTPVVLSSLHYCMNRGDYFNTASPFADLLRGDKPVLSLEISASDDLDVTGTISNTGSSILSVKTDGDIPNVLSQGWSFETPASGNKYLSTNDFFPVGLVNATSDASHHTAQARNYLKANASMISKALNVEPIVNSTLSAKILASEIAEKVNGITLDHFQLKSLEALTLFRTRMALTDGYYNSMITAQFGYNPHADDHRPKYIGGCYGDIMYNEVVNQAVAATESTQKDLLGYSASKASSAAGGYLGKCHAPDFGYCITVLYIQQDNTYTQGVSRMLTDLNVSDTPFPLMQNVAPQPIKNKELFISGDPDVDNDVFAYSAPFEWMRSRQSECRGQYRLGDSATFKAEFDSAMVQKRIFSDTPQFNSSFMTQSPQNIDMSLFAVQNEAPFDAIISKQANWIAPLAYDYDPEGLDPTKGM